MYGKCNGKRFKIECFKNMQPFDVSYMYIIIVKLGDIFSNTLKYCSIVMDLLFQKVTLTLVFIVKCMGVYIF